MKKVHSFDDAPVTSGRTQRPRPEDMVSLAEFKPQTWTGVRLFGGVAIVGGHWVKTKKKDGSSGSFYLPCAAFNSDTGKRDNGHTCPFCEFERTLEKSENGAQPISRFATSYFVNGFMPKQVAKATSMDDLGITPDMKSNGGVPAGEQSETLARVFYFSGATYQKVKSQQQLNVDDDDTAHSLTSATNGADLNIMHDPKVAPANQWQVQIKSPNRELTKIEKALVKYGGWDLAQLIPEVTEEEIQEEYEGWASRNGVGGSKSKAKGKPSMDDDDDDDIASTAKSKAKAKSRSTFDDDDDDGEEDTPKAKPKSRASFDAEDDEDDEDTPKAKPKAKVKPKASAFDDDDDGDDDEPAPKPKAKPKAKAPDLDDDDEDAPFDVKEKVKKAVSKKASAFDDDDDGDEPAPKPKAKAKAPSFDDDDDGDGDEPAPKAKKPAAKKKAPAFDDDDE